MYSSRLLSLTGLDAIPFTPACGGFREDESCRYLLMLLNAGATGGTLVEDSKGIAELLAHTRRVRGARHKNRGACQPRGFYVPQYLVGAGLDVIPCRFITRTPSRFSDKKFIKK